MFRVVLFFFLPHLLLASGQMGALRREKTILIKTVFSDLDQLVWRESLPDQGFISGLRKGFGVFSDNKKLGLLLDSYESRLPKTHAELGPWHWKFRRDLMAALGLDGAPPKAPSFEEGKKLYETHCLSCHGPKAQGDGVLTKKLPQIGKLLVEKGFPSRWTSPGMVYQSLIRRPSGSLMPDYSLILTNEELWAVGFYWKTIGVRPLPSAPWVPYTLLSLAQNPDGAFPQGGVYWARRFAEKTMIRDLP